MFNSNPLHEEKIAILGELKELLLKLHKCFSDADDSALTHIETMDYHVDKLLEYEK